MTSDQQSRSTVTPYPAGFEIRMPVKSFGLTVYEVLLHPRRFYSRLETERSEYPAMAFLYLVGAIATLSAFLVLTLTGSNTLFQVPFFGGHQQTGPFIGPAEFAPGFSNLWDALPTILPFTLLVPIFLIITNYLWAFVAHALAWFYMGRRAGNVKHTFRVIAYSNAVGLVALALDFVPFSVAPVATIWALYLLVIGVRRLNPRAAGYAMGEAASSPSSQHNPATGSARRS